MASAEDAERRGEEERADRVVPPLRFARRRPWREGWAPPVRWSAQAAVRGGVQGCTRDGARQGPIAIFSMEARLDPGAGSRGGRRTAFSHGFNGVNGCLVLPGALDHALAHGPGARILLPIAQQESSRGGLRAHRHGSSWTQATSGGASIRRFGGTRGGRPSRDGPGEPAPDARSLDPSHAPQAGATAAGRRVGDRHRPTSFRADARIARRSGLQPGDRASCR